MKKIDEEDDGSFYTCVGDIMDNDYSTKGFNSANKENVTEDKQQKSFPVTPVQKNVRQQKKK